MRGLTLLLTLTAGLLLGWYAHERWGQVPSRLPAAESPALSPGFANRYAPPDSGFSTTPRDFPVSALPALDTLASAVEYYEMSQARADTTGMQQARDAVLLYAQQDMQRGDDVVVAQWLQRFLLASYRDVDVRLLLAEMFYARQDYQGSIEQLYEAKGYAIRPQMMSRITRRIRAVVDEQSRRLRDARNTTGLLELFQTLTQLEPDYAAYFIELAVTQLALDDRDAAQRSLTLVVNDPAVGEQARQMLASLQESGPDATGSDQSAPATEVAGVPLVRRGQHFLVDVEPAGSGSLRLLIDTGASMTMLTSGALQRRGLRYRETGRSRLFNTANGQVRAPIYVLESLSVGDWYVQQLEVGVLDLDGQSGIDGLLGMNFLSHFRFFIDQNEPMLRLSLN